MSDEPQNPNPETGTESTAEPVPAGAGQSPAPAEADQTQVSASPTIESAVEEALSKWVNGHLTNSPLAQATDAWNHVMSSLNALRTYLAEEIKKL